MYSEYNNKKMMLFAILTYIRLYHQMYELLDALFPRKKIKQNRWFYFS